MTTLQTLKDLLLEALSIMYNAEKQLAVVLPMAAAAVDDQEVRSVLSQNLQKTKSHVERVERAIAILDAAPGERTCRAMKGLIEDITAAMQSRGPSAIRDANLVGVAQCIEHYQIGSYSAAMTFAETLNDGAVLALMQASLKEKNESEKTLRALSRSINEDAFLAGARG